MKRLTLLLLLSSMASGQGVFVSTQQVLKTINGVTSPVPNATVTVCAANASGIPCTPVLNSALFKDAALTQSLTNPFTADANGNYVFAIAPGNYTVTVTAATFVGYSYQVTAPLAAGANNTFTGSTTFSGAANLNAGGSLIGTFTGPATFSGTNTFSGANILCNANTILYVGQGGCFVGADIGAQLNAAYASCPSNGCTIYVAATSSAYNFSTPITFTTNNKPVTLLCTSPGNAVATTGCVLNYTPTTATAAITIDFGIVTGGVQSGALVKGITLINNNCSTGGGCGSSAVGIQIGNTNGGALKMRFENNRIQGFGTGYANSNATAFSHVFDSNLFLENTTAVNIAGQEEMTFINNLFITNGTGITSSNSEIEAMGNSFDSQTVVGITYTNTASPVSCTLIGNHFENNGQSNTHFVSGTANFYIFGGIFENDNVGGSSDWLVSASGITLDVYGTEVTSSQTLTVGYFQVAGVVRASIQAEIGTPSAGNPLAGGANLSTTTMMPMNGASSSSPLPWAFESPLSYKETVAPTAVAGQDMCYGDSTAHAAKCSYNGGSFFSQTQTIASGTATMTTAAIAAGACGTTVTVAAANVATTDTITWAFNAAPGGQNAGLVAWPTSGNVNFAYCSNTAETPAAATINWRVVR